MRINKFLFKSIIIFFSIMINISYSENKIFPSLIPKPNKIELKEGCFYLNKNTQIFTSSEQKYLAEYFQQQIETNSEIKNEINLNTDSKEKNIILLKIDKSLADTNIESYNLSVNTYRIILSAKTEIGLFRGIHTLLQLFPLKKDSLSRLNIPCCEIKDKPGFVWRGLNLDCGRHFMTKDFIKRYIDILAQYKFNIFHWHLTEDQGWRIEIKKYPKLTNIGAWRKEPDGSIYGGYYTQEDIREIVAYAKSRFITIVPEIEMPGHCLASLASYPEHSCKGEPFEVGNQWGVMNDVYCAGNDSTFVFLQNILSEVVELFPGEYIHIGGDEVPKDRWKTCPKCQNRMKNESIKNERELQTYFIKRIADFLLTRGKKIIGWDEILEGGLTPGATVQSWQSFIGAIEAVKQKHFSICSPASHTYLNSDPEYLSMRSCYSFDPIPENISEEESKYILGSEVNLWTEHAPQETVDSKLFPRILALAEVFWTEKPNRNYDDFYKRAKLHYDRLIKNKIDYGRESKAILSESTFDEDKNLFKVVLKPGQADLVIRYTLDGTTPDIKSPVYTQPIQINETTSFIASAFLKNRFIGNSVNLKFIFHKGHNSDINVLSNFNERYSAGGLKGLIDGLRGSDNLNDGLWQGYEEVDFEIAIDLKKNKNISKVTLGCLQDIKSWIFFPTEVKVQISTDNLNFIDCGKQICNISDKKRDAIQKDFTINFKESSVRFIKIKAKNKKICPEWHPGAGGKAWIFIDEIIIE